MSVDPQRYGGVRVAQPSGDRAHVGAACDRRGGSEVPELMEMSRQPDPVGQALVLVRQAVGQARLGPVSRPGEDERVVDQLYSDPSGKALLIASTPGQERSQGIVDGNVTALVGLGRPLAHLPVDDGQGAGDSERPSRPIDIAPAQRAQFSAAGTGYRRQRNGHRQHGVRLFGLSNQFLHIATAGADAVERAGRGGVARSAGLEGSRPHLTARPSEAWITEWCWCTVELARPFRCRFP